MNRCIVGQTIALYNNNTNLQCKDDAVGWIKYIYSHSYNSLNDTKYFYCAKHIIIFYKEHNSRNYCIKMESNLPLAALVIVHDL